MKRARNVAIYYGTCGAGINRVHKYHFAIIVVKFCANIILLIYGSKALFIMVLIQSLFCDAVLTVLIFFMYIHNFSRHKTRGPIY